MTLELVMASANPGKVAEIEAILAAALPGVVVHPRPAEVPDVVEDADTLEGNARLKAVALADATGLPAVADDTGLEVDALDGRPGVWSARYAGEDGDAEANITKLLGELDGVTSRSARFRTVVLVRWPDGREVLAEGTCPGRIATERSGGAGFGYDPVFVPDEADGRTFAAMAADEKHAISHRGRALRSLASALVSSGEVTA